MKPSSCKAGLIGYLHKNTAKRTGSHGIYTVVSSVFCFSSVTIKWFLWLSDKLAGCTHAHLNYFGRLMGTVTWACPISLIGTRHTWHACQLQYLRYLIQHGMISPTSAGSCINLRLPTGLNLPAWSRRTLTISRQTALPPDVQRRGPVDVHNLERLEPFL